MKFREIIIKSLDLETRTYIDSNDVIKEISPLEIYLVPKEGGEHDRYVSDVNALISKQSAGAGGNFIPMKGVNIAISESVTGRIVFANYLYSTYQPSNEYEYIIDIGNNGGFYMSQGNSDNLALYHSLYIHKNNGFLYKRRWRHGNEKKEQEFKADNNGTGMSLLVHPDPFGDYSSRSGSVLINEIAGVVIQAGHTDMSTSVVKNVDITFNAQSVSTLYNFYNSGIAKQTIFSFNGIKTDTLPNAQGDPTFTRQLVQKEDGSVGYEPKNAAPIPHISISVVNKNLETGEMTIGIVVDNVPVEGSSYGQPIPDSFEWEVQSIGIIDENGILDAIAPVPLNNPTWGSDYKRTAIPFGENFSLFFSVRISGANVNYYDSFGAKAFAIVIRIGNKFYRPSIIYKPFI